VNQSYNTYKQSILHIMRTLVGVFVTECASCLIAYEFSGREVKFTKWRAGASGRHKIRITFAVHYFLPSFGENKAHDWVTKFETAKQEKDLTQIACTNQSCCQLINKGCKICIRNERSRLYF